jgi:hypothetical protein
MEDCDIKQNPTYDLFTDSSLPNKESLRLFYFVEIMAYLLPLPPNVCLAVLFGYYPAQPFVAERGKSTILSTKYFVVKMANG